MKNIILIYDNHIHPGVFIKSIVGEKTFGDIILKRKSAKERFFANLNSTSYLFDARAFDDVGKIEEYIKAINLNYKETSIIHVFSYAAMRNPDEVLLDFQKAQFANKNLAFVCGNHPVALIIKSVDEYNMTIQTNVQRLENIDFYKDRKDEWETIPTMAFADLSDYSSFLQYISSGFDARYFNSLKGDSLTVTKTSTDSKKINAEYQFYYLLPDDMKFWFVMPYNFTCNDQHASYTMERLHIPDLAIRWVHGAIQPDEFQQLMNKVFCFIMSRKCKEAPQDYCMSVAEKLYKGKVVNRIENLKKNLHFEKLNALLTNGTSYNGIDGLADRYFKLYEAVKKRRGAPSVLTIGHGDLCFSNMLYSKEADLLKLIDPKGATKEEELWTDPYYDVAKLSHSVCGLYDFFNNALHQIELDDDLTFKLKFGMDNREYIEIFRRMCEKNGFDYCTVRLYEASLFLSMLPLHMDNPQKVFGFILNAIRIMDEVETCLKK